MTDEDNEIDSLANILVNLDKVLFNLNEYRVLSLQLEQGTHLVPHLSNLDNCIKQLGSFIFNKKALQALKIERKRNGV